MRKHELLNELRKNGIEERILNAIKAVKRENFVLPENKRHAYANYPLPIHEGQTISQPLTVALMVQWLDVKPGHNVLEIGAGSGYQAAVLSMLVGSGKVTTCEVREKLFEFAKKNLGGYKNVEVVHADASRGHGGEYDRIIAAASASRMPEDIMKHLKDGGKAVVPVGDEMWLIEKTKEGIRKEMMGYFSFVPLVE